MGHIIKISTSKDWYAANWAAEHVVRLIVQFLPDTASGGLRQKLGSMDELWDLDFSESPASDLPVV